MILRELHVNEGKFSVACVDACDERVVRHIYFPRKSLKDSCLNARGKCGVGNSTRQQSAVFYGKVFGIFKWWSRWDLNPRPPRCHRGALPTAPRPHRLTATTFPVAPGRAPNCATAPSGGNN